MINHLCSLNLLDSISVPFDLKKLKPSELPQLCSEIRTYFIENILEIGGHFSANLGVVELTVALHYVFNLENDKLVWDVGHQSYIHKILTGRKNEFRTIRKKDGLSGFPKITESPYDHFGTGHSSTSISAVLGMAESALLNNNARNHIAIIGDGSLSGGMSFEALNNLGVSSANVLVIVNDNQMGIDPNLGAIGQHLNSISENPNTNIFQNLQIPYNGPFDGHDVLLLVDIFKKLDQEDGPKVLHLKTIKGKGYEPAEKEQTNWHSVSYVKIRPDKDQTRIREPMKFQDAFGKTLVELAEQDSRVVGVTPAMPSGSSMKFLMDKMPERVFDVGIAEQHAVTFSAGLALDGKRPFCNIYSSFAQRAYDQIIHDVALQNIPVIFCLDRAGLVGEDGPTHHGSFDLSFLLPIPNVCVLAPIDEAELRNMMFWAVDHHTHPVFIRYPRGLGSNHELPKEIRKIETGKSRYLQKGGKIAIISVGQIGTEVIKAISTEHKLAEITHVDAYFVKPMDTKLAIDLMQAHEVIITVEDGCLKGGFGQQFKDFAFEHKYKGTIHSLGYPDEFIEHGEVGELRKFYKLDAQSIAEITLQLLQSL